ncbi:MAG: hypothetical protein M1820_009973 [Bogoriella megaspora]|nr:MAG: hypothetical protein M1820_009973 [Bogoriella megaspora]
MSTSKDSSSSWEYGDRSDSVSIGTHSLYLSVSGRERKTGDPVIIVFTGAGASLESWRDVERLINPIARVLLYDRAGLGKSEPGPNPDTGAANAQELSQLLKAAAIDGPYILVAHSYGGCIAREFLQRHLGDVIGVVLSETGTETRCQYHEMQYRKRILDPYPLSVLRGADAIKIPVLESSDMQDSIAKRQHQQRQMMAEKVNEADERLKKEQLQLSSNHRFQNIPCGHSIHRDRPDLVAEEIKWVLTNSSTISGMRQPTGAQHWATRWARMLMCSP